MSKQRPSYIPEDKWIEDIPSYVLKVARQYLHPERFGFHETYRDDTGVILKSEWCRINFHVNWEQHPYNHYAVLYELSIYYGRLHAPDRELKMLRQGEKYECWLRPWPHRFFDFIQDAFPKAGRPSKQDIGDEFRKKAKGFPDAIPWRIALEAEYWKYYAPELFYLFDLRRPELWEQYRAWLKALYIAEGENEAEDEKQGLIPYYRVC